MKKALFALLLTGVIALTATFLGVVSRGSGSEEATLGAGGEITRLGNDGTSTSVLINTTSTTVLATSTSRLYAAIVNDGSNVIYLNIKGGIPAVAYEGIRLNPGGGTFELTSENMYYGAITAIAVGGTSSTTVTQK